MADKKVIVEVVNNEDKEKKKESSGCGCGCFTSIIIFIIFFAIVSILDYNNWVKMPPWIMALPNTIWGIFTKGLWWIFIIVVGFIIVCFLLWLGSKIFTKPIRKFNRWRIAHKLPKGPPNPRGKYRNKW